MLRVVKELFQQIKLNKYSSKHKKLINQISSKKNSVAIQIRIFSKVGGEDKFHKNISSKYIEKAKKKIQNKVNKPFYFIFTNSSNWVSENLNLNKSNYILVKGFEDFEDLISISKCKHQIISNSTFGWWGAWLNKYNKKIVILPKYWFAKKKNPAGLFPKNWIKI